MRALGLLPLPDADRPGAALRRYQVLREFERGANAFGPQRRQSELTAARIGVDNLARNSGLQDPQRFIWTMEVAEAGELADGPVAVTVEDVTVSLVVNDDGEAELLVRRGDTRLKSVPAPLRKQEALVSLTARRAELRKQATRVRRSLEDAMVRQDRFGLDDLGLLDRHPVVAPMTRRVVWVDDTGTTFVRAGQGWFDARGSAALPTGEVRIAHPVDLLASGDWVVWQERFVDDARQPFPQVFRELHVLDDTEHVDPMHSRRWSGHRLQADQAYALFVGRGWVREPDHPGMVKVHHHAGVAARLAFLDRVGVMADVDTPTIDDVVFTGRGDYTIRPLASIPPVVFSETMRDLGLVVAKAAVDDR